MSMSVASMTGAVAAMALPPQMPVPALMRLLVFQSSPSAFADHIAEAEARRQCEEHDGERTLPTVSTRS